MPKTIPVEVKERAFELYLSGDNTVPEIVNILDGEFDVKVKAPTIYEWTKQEDWVGQRALARTRGIESLSENESQRFARLQTEQLDTYEQISAKAYRELKGLTFDNALAAVRAIDTGIRGQRDVMEGMINLQFVQDILGVLVEEINDKDTLNRIAVRLKTLIQSQE